jgi:hypothetical protein
MIVKQISDIYKHKEIEGELHEVLFKKNVITRRYIESPNKITSVDEVLTANGKPYKSRCLITLETGEQIMIKHSFDEIINYKQPNKIRGFYGRD